ncbi:hypothetical protein Tco_1328066 [Tanacetum coccineum]
MDDAGAYEEIKRVNANCTLKDNLQQASTSGTQTDKAPVYDSDESAEVYHLENCYDNDIFNTFTQEEQYTELLEPIPESHQVPQNDSNVIFEVSSMEQSGRTVEQNPATPEETRALYDSLYNNLATKVKKVNSVDRKLRETNTDLTIELARCKNQEKCFEISQEKYEKLERCYQKSVYQEQCLTKKMNALHLSSGKQITTLNEEISNLNKRLSKEKSTVSSLLEEKKKLKSDFKIRKDELLDKQIQLENKIKELDNILVKTEADESLAKHKALELEIERLLRVVVNQDIMSTVQNNYVVNTSNLQTELEHKLHDTIYENAKLRAQLFDKVSEQKDTNKVTSKSEPSSRESIVVNNERVIAPGIFRINPFKASRVDNFVPNKHVKASIRTKPITVSQSHGITKNDVNSKTNGFSPNNVESTTRTRRPQPRNNPKSDKVPFKSKSSCLSNKLEKIKENHRSLQSSNYPDHTSSECNNIKLVIQNEKSEVICATCKQCLITANHDEYVLQYVNGMKSRKKNQSANVSKSENQKKHKAQVWKPKNVGSKERLASPKPSKPRSCLRWSPTGRLFDLKGIIIASSESES